MNETIEGAPAAQPRTCARRIDDRMPVTGEVDDRRVPPSAIVPA